MRNLSRYLFFALIAIPILLALAYLFQQWNDERMESQWNHQDKHSSFDLTAYSVGYLDNTMLLFNDTLVIDVQQLKNSAQDFTELEFIQLPVHLFKAKESDTVFIKPKHAETKYLIFK